MSVNPTSIQSGFARSRSEALFPRLFPDAGWWCPSLQSPGGSRLHDLSGRQNWGTLINMANNDWVVSGGRGALDLDGSNDHVPLYNGRLYDLTNQSLVYTISLWASTRNVVNTQHCFGDYNSSGVNNLFSIVFNFTTNGTLHAYGNGLGTEVLLTNALQSNVWYNIVIVRNGGSTYAAYLNGVFKGTSSSLNAVSAF